MYSGSRKFTYTLAKNIETQFFSQLLTFNPSKNAGLGQLRSPLYFMNVKCQNNSREKDIFQMLFISSHSQWVRSLHTLN